MRRKLRCGVPNRRDVDKRVLLRDFLFQAVDGVDDAAEVLDDGSLLLPLRHLRRLSGCGRLVSEPAKQASENAAPNQIPPIYHVRTLPRFQVVTDFQFFTR